MTIRPGVTLLELLVVIVLLGVIASMSVAPFHATAVDRHGSQADAIRARIAAARGEALRTARQVTVTLRDNSHVVAATALPTGELVIDSLPAVQLDRLSGAARKDTRDAKP